jgi:hypothetical protein
MEIKPHRDLKSFDPLSTLEVISTPCLSGFMCGLLNRFRIARESSGHNRIRVTERHYYHVLYDNIHQCRRCQGTSPEVMTGQRSREAPPLWPLRRPWPCRSSSARCGIAASAPVDTQGQRRETSALGSAKEGGHWSPGLGRCRRSGWAYTCPNCQHQERTAS